MNDTVKRKAVIATIRAMYERCDADITDYRDLMLESVKVLPSADTTSYEKGYADAVQGIADELVKQGKHIESDRPQGEWIEQEECWQCSECGDEYVLEVGVKPIDARMYYCPSCGARMHPRLQGKHIDSIVIDEILFPWKGTGNGKECHKPESEYYRAYCEERKEETYCEGCKFWY